MDRTCMLCGKPYLAHHRHALCYSCFRDVKNERIDLLDTVACSTCGRPLLLRNQECTHEGIDLFVRRLFLYRFMMKDLIVLYKFHGQRHISFLLSHLIWDTIREQKLTTAVIVPVPCSSEGIKKRGFDQCRVIADHLRHTYGMEVCDRILRRKKSSRPQKSMTRDERLGTGKARFYLNRSACSHLDGRHIILIDDIITTGATLTEAAGVLAACRYKEISALVLAMD